MLPAEEIDRVDLCLRSLSGELSRAGIVLEERLEFFSGFTSRRKKWCQLSKEVYGKNRHYIYNRQGDAGYRKIIACFGELPKSGLWEHLRAYIYKEAKWTIDGEDVYGISYKSLVRYLEAQDCQQLLQQLSKDLIDSVNYARARYG